MPAEGLSSLGSPSGGVCGAAAALAPALLAAARGAARQRLGVSAGDARLGVAVGAWPGEDGIDVQGANALPLLSASAAAEGTVALAAAALAAVTAALAPLTLALAAGLSLPLRLASVLCGWRLVPRLLFLVGYRHNNHDVSMLATPRRDVRIRGR